MDEPVMAVPRVGAQVTDTGVQYSVWAPDHERLDVVVRLDGAERRVSLAPEDGGFFSGIDEQGKPGDLYQFDLGNGRRRPDPASRFQPQGVHGPSECIDAARHAWRTAHWRRPAWRGQTTYELHIGTFTSEGTFRAAIARLDHVAELGAEAIEILPVADFAGDRNWGYDGVALFAPARCYGRPDDLRALVDAAHERGLVVILDVVYNHLGPAGNYLGEFSRAYFHRTRNTPWGQGFNLDGPDSRPVRDFFLWNAVYWLDEFKVDGLRLDATHAITDDSEKHLLAQIAEAVHERGGFVVAEDERNCSELIDDAAGRGFGIDAVWSDDFHHQVRVALTRANESYFASYPGTTAALAETLEHGWFYTGQAFPFWKGRARGASCRHLPASAFVYCIENHDQVGNRARGERLEHLVSPAHYRAASALLCLCPYAPLLFMGQEWAAGSPFLFFTDHEGELGRLVSEGRRREFADVNRGLAPEDIPDPQSENTFLRSKLDWAEVSRSPHAGTLAFYRECLRVRKQWIHAALADRGLWSVGDVGSAIALRYEPPGRSVVLVVVTLNLGSIRDEGGHRFLLPPDGHRWRLALQSEGPEFGGKGAISGRALSETSGAGPWLAFTEPGAVVLVAEEDAGCR